MFLKQIVFIWQSNSVNGQIIICITNLVMTRCRVVSKLLPTGKWSNIDMCRIWSVRSRNAFIIQTCIRSRTGLLVTIKCLWIPWIFWYLFREEYLKSTEILTKPYNIIYKLLRKMKILLYKIFEITRYAENVNLVISIKMGLNT